MKFQNRFRWMAGLVVLAMVAVWHVQPAPAASLDINAGFDVFFSEPPTYFTLPSLPAGFFGMKSGMPSDIFTGQQVAGIGNPPITGGPYPTTIFVPDPQCHVSGSQAEQDCVKVPVVINPNEVSTVIQRGAIHFNNVGDTDTVPIEIVELHLTSIDPIMVTYGSEPPSFFDVFVDLDPAASQTPGSLQLTWTGFNTAGFPVGTMQTTLPVDFRLQFIGTEPSDPQAQMPLTGSTVLGPGGPGGTWQATPEPTTLLLFISGLAGVVGIGLRKRHVQKA